MMAAAAAVSLAADAAWHRLLQRLAATQPEHRAPFVRIGAGVTDQTDPRLLNMIPVDPRPAAVLIGFVEGAAGPAILLTVRAGHLRHHAGQIAFPGGVIEHSDASPAAAALREAQEEVGLAPQDAEVLGYLPDQIVLTGFRITPVVARLAQSFAPHIDAAEVQGTFMLPFAALLDAASERAGTRRLGGIDFSIRDLQYGEHRIWGATAGMLFALRALALP
jgi:8-oxo-dGTP pyrophosphatase MutT (NUDIX family)